jgi:hypothetical protein
MKLIKKIIISVLVLVLIFTLTDIPAISNPVVTQAATIKLDKTKLELVVGKTSSLHVLGIKKTATVKWSSSDKKTATVSTKGKVKAVAVGTAKITASVSGKKLTCTVTVKKPANPSLNDAPFDAQEVQVGNIDFVIPSDWTLTYNLTTGGIKASLKPNDTTNPSSIVITIFPQKTVPDYNYIKKHYTSLYTKDYFDTSYTESLGAGTYELTGLTQSDLTVSLGKVLKTEYTLTIKGVPLIQQIYDFIIESYCIEIDSNNVIGTDLSTIIEYTINSLIIEK